MKNVDVAEFSQNASFDQERSRQPENLLTERELTIVQCIAAGKSSLEIAAQLFISHHTVRTHRKNILQRTGAKNVAHLVQLAMVNGWI